MVMSLRPPLRWIVALGAVAIALLLVLRLAPTHPRGDLALLLQECLEAVRVGEPDRAEELLAELSAEGEGAEFEAAYLRGRLALEDGRLDQAERQLRLALARVPSDRPTRFSLGLVLEAQGHANEALEVHGALLAELEHDPDPWTLAALERLADLCERSGNLEDARGHRKSIQVLRAFGLESPDLERLRNGSLLVDGSPPL